LAPLVKTGGLADVSGALPQALAAMGHDVRVALPAYASIDTAHLGEQAETCVADLRWGVVQGALRESRVPNSEVPLYLIEHDGYFGRDGLYGGHEGDFPDNLERFSFFCMAVLDAIPKTGWMPDVVHCHDWHTALLPVFCKTRLARHPVWGDIPSVFTIHNLAYQGVAPGATLPRSGLGWDLFHPDGLEYYGNVNMMKGGIAYADKLNTVSKRYAREIQTADYGEGLEGALLARKADLSGIVNGVDYTEWNPATDSHLAAGYSAVDMAGKKECKRALQKRFGLPARDVPVIGMVSRLVAMKGFELVVEALPKLMAQDLQLVVLGTGAPELEEALAKAAKKHPDRLVAELAYNNEIAHQIYAGSDFFLMPSLVEPCGLSQLYSMAYGTLPIVRRTGGLSDTVRDASATNVAKSTATGIVFSAPKAQALARAVARALTMYTHKDTFKQVRRTAMQQDFSWDRSSKEYVKLYRKAMRAR
jgi:starch synthase